MEATARKALRLLREIKSVTFATLQSGAPAARVVDVMWVDEEGLYFLTARGKPFYRQLTETREVAICALSPSYVAIRVVGAIRRNDDPELATRVFGNNPVLATLYPGEKRDILEIFQVHRGRGELFDLSSGPPRRERFGFGGETAEPPGFRITEACTACGACVEACPVGVVDAVGTVYRIEGARCLECGRCAEVCPVDAIAGVEGL